MLMKNYNQILVLDFGSQYNQLIVRRIREMGVYSTLVSHNIGLDEIKNIPNLKGIILSGGPHSVYDSKAFACNPEIFSLGIPILGICYGMQLMAKTFGGLITKSEICEYGKSEIIINDASPLYDKLPLNQIVWMSHGDNVKTLPQGFKKIASSKMCELASIANEDKKLYVVQFHPEVEHTPFGQNMMRNFLYNICGLENSWSMASFAEEKIAEIKKIVGDKKLICALSGGVDSSVAAVMVHKAVGKQLTCIFVDHGLLRKDEGDQVEKIFKEGFDMNLIRVNAQDRFLGKLKGVSDPETKRKIIGEEFIRVFEEEARKLGDIKFLVQGTIYPDVVESGTDTSAVIKSHHNVGGLPEDMEFSLIEPLRELFKDEVRAVGEELGIPHHLVWRQPFPGPGLAIRVLGEVTEDKLEVVREADAIFREEIALAGLESEIWQYFAVLPNIQSVGVMGDERTYCHTVGLRAVTSSDGMTSNWAHIPYEVIDKVSRRIVNEVKGVNRIVYDVTSKPPATIEWE